MNIRVPQLKEIKVYNIISDLNCSTLKHTTTHPAYQT